jgi:hypothetical protein
VFSIGCLSIWVVLSLLANSRPGGRALPALTILFVNFRPLLIALPVVAALYCLCVWFRKADRVPSGMGFFATTMGSLVFVAFPAMVGAYLPLLAYVSNQLASK